mgnify:CR=1 FL=1
MAASSHRITPIVTATTVYAATAGQSLSGTVIKHEGGIVALDRTTGDPPTGSASRHARPPTREINPAVAQQQQSSRSVNHRG